MDNIILQYSIGRSGSTMIWQILKKLCEPTYKIIKCHPQQMVEFENSTHPIIITQRDPRDSILSYIRISHFGKNTELFESGLNLDILKSNINIWKNLENNLRHYVNNYKGSSIILRYENFYNDYDYIFNELGKLIDLDDLSDSFKQQIIDSTNINKNKKHQEKFGTDFTKHSDDTGIHGGHIKHPQPKLYERILNSEEQSFLNLHLKDEIKFWEDYWKNN